MSHPVSTPGVYIVELDAFPNSVVATPTGIPVFLGYTAKADSGKKAMRIATMEEYISMFGAEPHITYDYVSNPQATPAYQPSPSTPAFGMYFAMQMFFNNGGGVCYLCPLGTYDDAIAQGSLTKDVYVAALNEAEKCREADLLVMPDAVLLSRDDWCSVSQMALQSCEQSQHMMCILDVYQGYLPVDGSSQDPVTGGTEYDGFYQLARLGERYGRYGAAYYPWLNTNITSLSEIDYRWLSAASLPQLVTDLNAEAARLFPADSSGNSSKLQDHLHLIALLPQEADVIAVRQRHLNLMAISPVYQSCVKHIADSVNLLPPAAAMAGIYARTDQTLGVFHAPANTSIVSAISPVVTLHDQQQETLMLPLNGFAVNAIRLFPQYGVRVWGARTLAGNSDDWRYIHIRRTVMMLEQSIKDLLQIQVFQMNDAQTWSNVNTSIRTFLTDQWKLGMLIGSTPEDAYDVSVGLGNTMSAEGVLNGVMNVIVKLALVRPAEFIELTFQQQMQAS